MITSILYIRWSPHLPPPSCIKHKTWMHTYIMRIHPCQNSGAGSWQLPNKLSSFTFLLMFSETDMEGQRAEGRGFKHFYLFFSPDCQFQWEGNKWSKCLPQIQDPRNQIKFGSKWYNLISIYSYVLHIFFLNVFYYNSCLISYITNNQDCSSKLL